MVQTVSNRLRSFQDGSNRFKSVEIVSKRFKPFQIGSYHSTKGGVSELMKRETMDWVARLAVWRIGIGEW
jgi:hypothetical protein